IVSGKISERYRWACARTPMSRPERALIGTIASTPTWRLSVHPDDARIDRSGRLPCERPVSGVCSANSTRGTHPWWMRRPFRSPPEYEVVSRLYSSAKLQSRMFGLTVSVTAVAPVGSVLVERVVDWVVSATPTLAVTLIGRSHAIEYRRSPQPLPMA